MAELQESRLISAEECKDLAQDYSPGGYRWQSKLLRILVNKKIQDIRRITTVFEKQGNARLSKLSKVLKGVLCVGGVLTMSCNYYCILHSYFMYVYTAPLVN